MICRSGRRSVNPISVAFITVTSVLAFGVQAITSIQVACVDRVATVAVVTAREKLAVSARPGIKGRLHERGSICDDIVAFS